jgi:ABC-type amino acid transport substrate-binding protein
MKPRPTRLVVVAGLAIALTVAATAVLMLRSAPGKDLSLIRVQQSGVLTIGLDPSYPPFEFVNGSGELAGFDVDLAYELGRRLDVKAQLVAVDFGGIYDALDVGRFDLILGGVTAAPDEEPGVRYTRPYFDDGLVVVAGSISTGNALGIESGSDADLALQQLREKLTEFTFRPFDDQDQIHAAIVAHALRGAVVDRVTASLWSRDATELTIYRPDLTSVPYVIAARRGDGALLQAVDRALQTMLADGFVTSLSRKWLQS